MATAPHRKAAIRRMPVIKPFVNKRTGTQVWRVSATVLTPEGPKRIRRNYPTFEQAEQAHDELAAAIAALPGPLPDDRLVRTHLTDQQLRQAESFFEAYPDVPLMEAGRVYRQRKPFDSWTTVQDFIDDQRARGVRHRTLSNLAGTLKQMLRDTGGCRSWPAVRKWCNNPKWSLRTRRDRIDMVRYWLDWCVRQGYFASNPLADMSRPIVPGKLPAIVTVDQAEALLRAAARDRFEVARLKGNVVVTVQGLMLPWFALCLLSGVRPDEAQRLNWSDINFETGVIELGPAIAKVKRVRGVRLPANLVAILRHCKEQRGFLKPGFFSRHAFERIRRAAGVPWVQDIMRHSYVSHRYAIDPDLDEIARDCGNSVRILETNYLRRTVSAEDARKYFALDPIPHLDDTHDLTGGNPGGCPLDYVDRGAESVAGSAVPADSAAGAA